MEEAALKWFENLESTAGAAMTWVQIKDSMRSALQGVAWDEQMKFKLRLRMQGELEPVEAYVQDVINLCHKVDGNMLERVQIKHVLRSTETITFRKSYVDDK